ncbi:MAG TPA: ATP-binding protein, partial [bacterium]
MIKLILGKSISKLTIIFLSSILIPGFILAYFSIQTIANQKELTEKRLLEDQNEIATELSDYFHHQISKYTSNFFAHADSLYTYSKNDFVILDSLPFVAQAFIIGPEGEFKFPFYLRQSQLQQTPHKSARFLEIISRAEKSEFATTDLLKASQFYRDALKSARNKIESATAINGLARVLVKLGYNKQALSQYKLLADKYGSIIDNTGFPFAYYSIHQMVQLASADNIHEIIHDIEFILSRILSGQIPITDNTEFLLQEISKWLAEQTNVTLSSNLKLSQSISSIQKVHNFVSQEGNSIWQEISSPHNLTSALMIGKSRAIISNREDQPLLYFIEATSDKSGFIGFKIDLDSLRTQLLDFNFQKSVSFPIAVNIISRNETNQMEANPFCTIKELSPLVPAWRICITPQTPKVVNKFIYRRRWLYSIALTFLCAGMFLGVILVLRDVSREKRLARLRSDFVSNVSHELKTPLTSIRMFAETMLLGRYANKKVQQEYLSIIVNESARLTRLINSVLDFSKIEKGKKQYYLKSGNLSEVISSAIKSMEYFITQNGFTLTTEIDKNILAVVDADAIEQAVLNLLSNAVKYSRDRKEISVRLWEENESIFVEVADKGIGIPDSAQKYIFDKFYRAHAGHEKDTGGAGLGLTVVKHIVDAHHGKIELESVVGKGSAFTII